MSFSISWRVESSIDSKSISGRVRMLKSSIWAESEDWYRVLKSNQKIDIELQLDDQSISASLYFKILHFLLLY